MNITIAALPKPFIGHIGIIQRNAVQAWLQMHPRPQIILFGNEEGTAAVAQEFHLEHVPHVRCNPHGTPYLRDVFQEAERRMSGDLLCYSNCDIILFQDFIDAAQKLIDHFQKFLLVGECMNLDVKTPIDFSSPSWEHDLRTFMTEKGKRRGVCADYFAFTKGFYADIPELVLGRPYFDNWAIWNARHQGMPVIDATGRITAIHQNHFYAAVAGEKPGSHKGDEAEDNLKAMGGKSRIFWTTDRTHTLTAGGLKRDWMSTLLLRRRSQGAVKKMKYRIVDALRVMRLHE